MLEKPPTSFVPAYPFASWLTKQFSKVDLTTDMAGLQDLLDPVVAKLSIQQISAHLFLSDREDKPNSYVQVSIRDRDSRSSMTNACDTMIIIFFGKPCE